VWYCASSKGFCTFGRCQCYYGYTGESCDEQLVAPVITEPPGVFELREGVAFQHQLSLETGTVPIEWTFTSRTQPDGLALDGSTGLLTWPEPEASSNIISLRVQARNALASTSTELRFLVTPSYLVIASTSTISRKRPSSSFTFRFQTLAIDTLQPVGGKLATLWVRGENESGKRKTLIKTDSTGTFSRSYQPYGNDVGR